MPDTTLSVTAFDTLQSRLRFSGVLTARTGLRIGIGRDNDVAGRDLPVMRDASGRPFIPGASFKGALRAQLEAALRGLRDRDEEQRKLACYVLEREGRCIPDDTIKQWRKDLAGNNKTRPIIEQEVAKRVLSDSCLICQTLGSTWLASHIAIRDLAVEPALWFGQFEVRQGVSLDRDTETAREGLLYNFETVPAGTRFLLEIEADNLQPWQQGLLLLGLTPFVRGEASLGGARSRGLGQVILTDGVWSSWELGESRASSVLGLLRDGPQPAGESIKTGWRDALLAKLEEVARA